MSDSVIKLALNLPAIFYIDEVLDDEGGLRLRVSDEGESERFEIFWESQIAYRILPVKFIGRCRTCRATAVEYIGVVSGH